MKTPHYTKNCVLLVNCMLSKVKVFILLQNVPHFFIWTKITAEDV